MINREFLQFIKNAYDKNGLDISLNVKELDHNFFNKVNSDLELNVSGFPLSRGDKIPQDFYDKVLLQVEYLGVGNEIVLGSGREIIGL